MPVSPNHIHHFGVNGLQRKDRKMVFTIFSMKTGNSKNVNNVSKVNTPHKEFA